MGIDGRAALTIALSLPATEAAPHVGRTAVRVRKGRIFATRAEARRAIFRWINWYNTSRLHSSLGYVAPIEWEHRYHQPALTTTQDVEAA